MQKLLWAIANAYHTVHENGSSDAKLEREEEDRGSPIAGGE